MEVESYKDVKLRSRRSGVRHMKTDVGAEIKTRFSQKNKKSLSGWKGFCILGIPELLLEFRVFVLELVNTSCSIDKF